jgi:hypothetical protein
VTAGFVSGTEGYAEEAEELFKHYESFPAADAHRAVLHLIPTAPSSILDIGSGTGRDAAWFAAQGHRVVAVEPTDALRLPAMTLHPSPLIEWLNDSLPDLAVLQSRGKAVAKALTSSCSPRSGCISMRSSVAARCRTSPRWYEKAA